MHLPASCCWRPARGAARTQLLLKPGSFVLRDFQAAVTKLRSHEGWLPPDTKKLGKEESHGQA